MSNSALRSTQLQHMIDGLDPQQDDVIICHLNDAMEALLAKRGGHETRYTVTGTVINGVVWGRTQS